MSAPPIQMTSQTLNALKGWPQPAAVDFNALLDPSISGVVPPGTVVHLGPALTYLLGVGTAAVMPMFTFQGSNDPDVSNYGGDPATQKGVWIPISPTGQLMSLVAVGAYELVSTNYDDTQPYPPNTHLTSPLVAAGAVAAGMLTPGTIGAETIVGVVSRGVVDNGYGTDALAFWPYYLPAAV